MMIMFGPNNLLRRRTGHATLLGAFLSLTALATLAQGCNSANTDLDIQASKTVVRTYESSFAPATKATLSSSGSVAWAQGDVVVYYDADGGELRQHTVQEAGSTATLPLTLDDGADYLVAVIGAGAVSNHTKNAVTLSDVVKAEQDGSFSGGHVAVARTSNVQDQKLTFHNVVSFISFTTKRKNISYVVFSSADSTPIHGNGQVNLALGGEFPEASYGTATGSSIKIPVSGAGTYYIATLPAVLSGGFVISCYDVFDKLIGTATGTNPLTINRSKIANLGSIDAHLVDENGIALGGYGNDGDWDSSAGSGGDIGHNGYGEDYDWDSNTGSNGNIGNGDYGDDSNWDSSGKSSGNINNDDYGSDNDWNTNTGSSGSIGGGGYGGDNDWGSDSGSEGGIDNSGYGEDNDWN